MSKKILYILSIISIFALVFSIVTTYAKYSSQSDKNVSFNLTSWNLKINDTDISSNSNFSSNITPVFTNTNYIDDSVIAPTSTGYFDVIVDSSTTNLSFEYLLTVSNTNSSVVDYNITGYSINDLNSISPYNNSIAGEVLFDKTNRINSTTIRIYVEWNDSEINSANNTADTELAVNNSSATLNVEITINQKIDTYTF